jgi:predicted metal-dependent phosphoesterase TrpH
MKIEKLSQLGKADLHIHSNYSDARPTIKEILEFVQNETDLDIIAICDHDTIEGALKAKNMAKKNKYRFEIIIGEEVSSKEGHVLGLFLSKTIPPGLSAKETIAKIKSQGGIVIAPHPLYHTRLKSNHPIMDGLGLISLLKEKDNIDGVEVINGNPALRKENIEAHFVNETLLFKSEIGGSDAHILEAIGKGYTIFEGKTATELKEAILNGQTRAMSNQWGFFATLRYAFFLLPKGIRISIYTLLHGRNKKRPQLINFPKK